LKDGTTWYVWSDAVGGYIPATTAPTSLGYIVSVTAPDPTVYQVWFQVSASGVPLYVRAYNSNVGKWQAFTNNAINDVKMFAGTQADLTNIQNPLGWYIADGGTYNGVVTKDLRNSFPVGAGAAVAIGQTGGSQYLPLHTHGLTGGVAAGVTGGHGLSATENAQHSHTMANTIQTDTATNLTGGAQSRNPWCEAPGTPGDTLSTAFQGNGTPHTHPLVGTTDNQASTIDSRPPFYGLWMLWFCGPP